MRAPSSATSHPCAHGCRSPGQTGPRDFPRQFPCTGFEPCARARARSASWPVVLTDTDFAATQDPASFVGLHRSGSYVQGAKSSNTGNSPGNLTRRILLCRMKWPYDALNVVSYVRVLLPRWNEKTLVRISFSDFKGPSPPTDRQRPRRFDPKDLGL